MHETVVRALALQQDAKSLAAEANLIWSEVEGYTATQIGEDVTREKLQRLREVRMKMTSTAADFTEIMKRTPGVVTWLDRGPMTSPSIAATPLAFKEKPKENVSPSPSGVVRRMSRYAVQSADDMASVYAKHGGRLVNIPTGSEYLGELECILLEPSGEFTSTGVAVCLQGLPFSHDTVEEWCASVTLLGLLQMGVTVAVPNMQASSALNVEDLSFLLGGIGEFVDSDTCILVGKDLMAHHIVALTFAESSDVRVAGVLLLGPCSPAPVGLEDLSAPLLVLWAKDDPISGYEDRLEWLDAFGPKQIARMSTIGVGGHRLDSVLAGGCVEVARNFFISCFLLMQLLHDMSESQCRVDHEPKTDSEIRFRRLFSELPHGLQDAVNTDEGSKRMCLASRLASWIQSGLRGLSE